MTYCEMCYMVWDLKGSKMQNIGKEIVNYHFGYVDIIVCVTMYCNRI